MVYLYLYEEWRNVSKYNIAGCVSKSPGIIAVIITRHGSNSRPISAVICCNRKKEKSY